MEIEVKKYDPRTGVLADFEAGAQLSSAFQNGVFEISGNRAGLISLARHCLALAQEGVPTGAHFHLDDSYTLEPGSSEFLIALAQE